MKTATVTEQEVSEKIAQAVSTHQRIFVSPHLADTVRQIQQLNHASHELEAEAGFTLRLADGSEYKITVVQTQLKTR